MTPVMQAYKEEIFGPVLQMVRAENFEEALALPSKHQCGNGVAVFSRDGYAAREFAARMSAGSGSTCRSPCPTIRSGLETVRLRRHQPARLGRRQILDQGQDNSPSAGPTTGQAAIAPSSFRPWAAAVGGAGHFLNPRC